MIENLNAKRNVIIPTSHALHLQARMPVGLSANPAWEFMPVRGNKEGQLRFPDGEVYARLPESLNDVDGRIVVLHSGGIDPNGGLVELEMVLAILRRHKKRNVEVYFTYFAYGMQDRAFRTGETNAAEDLLEKLCWYYGVKRIHVLDAHFQGDDWAEKFPICYVTAVPLLQEAVRKVCSSNDLSFLGPDAGSQKRANVVASKKKRANSFDVKIEFDRLVCSYIEGHDVCMLDDLLETGGTAGKFLKACRDDYGAKKLFAAVTHGVMVEGINRVKSLCDQLFLTNSIDRGADSNVCIGNLVLGSIMRPRKVRPYMAS